MKKTNKKLNMLGNILMIVVVFLCGFNVTYAYFTAKATVEGSLTFYDLNVTFAYSASGSNESQSTGSTEFEVIPNTTSILRGHEFSFKLADGTAITNVGLMPSTTSCDSYARLTVSAIKMVKSGDSYTADSSDTTDYGQYILLTTTASVKKSGEFYYLGSVMTAGGYYAMATGATISTDAPADVTSSYIKITIKFEAVQAEKTAVVATFGEEAATLLGL